MSDVVTQRIVDDRARVEVMNDLFTVCNLLIVGGLKEGGKRGEERSNHPYLGGMVSRCRERYPCGKASGASMNPRCGRRNRGHVMGLVHVEVTFGFVSLCVLGPFGVND